MKKILDDIPKGISGGMCIRGISEGRRGISEGISGNAGKTLEIIKGGIPGAITEECSGRIPGKRIPCRICWKFF